jgi:hypothetical protein
VLSQMNEYEVLQLLLGECRERLAAYSGNPSPMPASPAPMLLHALGHSPLLSLHAYHGTQAPWNRAAAVSCLHSTWGPRADTFIHVCCLGRWRSLLWAER